MSVMTAEAGDDAEVDWEAQTGMCQWSTSTFENTCGSKHCPGHAGVKGNDRADRLVGKATSQVSHVSEDLKC